MGWGRRARKGKKEVHLVMPQEVFAPQVQVVMTRDLVGSQDTTDGQLKYQLSAGKQYYVDIDTAAEFITKGYAKGELPREVTEDERHKWRSEQSVVRPGG